jgi:hypothetical protein
MFPANTRRHSQSAPESSSSLSLPSFAAILRTSPSPVPEPSSSSTRPVTTTVTSIPWRRPLPLAADHPDDFPPLSSIPRRRREVITLSPDVDAWARQVLDDIDGPDAAAVAGRTAYTGERPRRASMNQIGERSAPPSRPSPSFDGLPPPFAFSTDELLNMGDATRPRSPPAGLPRSPTLPPNIQGLQAEEDDIDEDPDGQLFYTSLLNGERSRLRRRVAAAAAAAASTTSPRRSPHPGDVEESDRAGNVYMYTFESPDEVEWRQRSSAAVAASSDAHLASSSRRPGSDQSERPVLVLYCGRRKPPRPRLPRKFTYVDDDENEAAAGDAEGGCGALVCARAMTARLLYATTDAKAGKPMFTTDLPPCSQAVSFLGEAAGRLDGSSSCSCVRVALGCRIWCECFLCSLL